MTKHVDYFPKCQDVENGEGFYQLFNEFTSAQGFLMSTHSVVRTVEKPPLRRHQILGQKLVHQSQEVITHSIAKKS